MDKYLTIGEMSRLFKLNIQTLHYYDSIGLLTPANRDPDTGYRKYIFEQTYTLATIRYLRKIGYSLKEIVRYMDYRGIEYTLGSLKEQSLSLKKQLEELIDIDTAIQRKIRFIELELKNIDFDKVVVETFEKRYYLPIGDENILYKNEAFYFYPTIAFYEKNTKYFGAYIFCENIEEEKEFLNNFSNISTISKGKYLCGYHLGKYESIFKTVKIIRESGKNLNLSESVINFNIIDQFVEEDRNKYITKLQIPIID